MSTQKIQPTLVDEEAKIEFVKPLNYYKLKRKGIDFTRKFGIYNIDVKMNETLTHLEK